MSEQFNTAVGIFNNPKDAAIAAKALQKAGFNMRKLSLIEGVLVGCFISALAWGEMLTNTGSSKTSINQYENTAEDKKLMLLVQGGLAEVKRATYILMQNHAEYASYRKVVVGEHVNPIKRADVFGKPRNVEPIVGQS
jgi:hypothetical protein